MKGVGRVRAKLAAMLDEAGFAVAPDDLHAANRHGVYVKLDVVRWWCEARDKASGQRRLIESWDTMSRIVQEGLYVRWERVYPTCELLAWSARSCGQPLCPGRGHGPDGPPP